LNKKIEGLQDISDKNEFFKEAHKIYQAILKLLRKKDMLMREIPTALG